MQFKKQSDMGEIKEISKIISRSIDLTPFMYDIVSHPFTNNLHTGIIINGSVKMLNLSDKTDFMIWKDNLFKLIDEAEVPSDIYLMVNTPYKLTMIKYWKPYLSLKDFSELLSDAWTISEAPNKDINVTVRTLKNWFKQADKYILMDKDEYKEWENLPDEFIIYRGVGSKSTPKGLSWTRNINTAEWFANRRKGNKYILKETIKKSQCLAYFNRRGEDEIIVDITNINPVKIDIVDI